MLIRIDDILIPRYTPNSPYSMSEIKKDLIDKKRTQTVLVEEIGGKYVLVQGAKIVIEAFKLGITRLSVKVIDSGLLSAKQIVEGR